MKKNLKQLHRLAAVAVIIGTQFQAPHARAQDVSNENVQALIERVKELEQKVKVLERNQELDQEAATEKTRATPTVTLGAGGLNVRSADSNFVFNLRGYVQMDGRFYFNDRGTGNDTFLLRRVRPIFEGTVFEKYDYKLMLDFGSGLNSVVGNNGFVQDAYIDAHLWPQLSIQAGKYKAPVGLERLKSARDLVFIERGFPTQLVPNREVGIALHNDLFNSTVNYEVGVFNGVADAGSEDIEVSDEGKDFEGRLFFQPFLTRDVASLRGLGFGIAGTTGQRVGGLPSFVTPGQRKFFSYASGTGTAASPLVTADGNQYRFMPQAYYYWGPLGVLGEYVVSSQRVKQTAGGTPTYARYDNKAWQVTASYLITGEENTFKSIVPLHPFVLGGTGWGAFEIVARVQQLSLDQDIFPRFAAANSARRATAVGGGANWYLNRNVKLSLDYESTNFTGGSNATGSVTARPEHAILSRIQFTW